MFSFPVSIIFSKLSYTSAIIAMLMRVFFRNIYYIEIGSSDKSKVAKRLSRLGIFPLPIADLEKISTFADSDSDPQAYAWTFIDNSIGNVDFVVLQDLFPNVKNLDQKIRLELKDFIAHKLISTGNKLIFWNENYPTQKIFFLSFSLSDYGIPKFPPNCHKFIFPFPNIFDYVSALLKLAKSSLSKIKRIFDLKRKANTQTSYSFQWGNYLHGYVTHAGLTYGSMYTKNLYYSNTDPFFDSKNLVHFDYSGLDSPSHELPWWRLATAKKLKLKTIISLMTKLSLRLNRHIVSVRNLLLYIRLLILVLKFHAYIKDLSCFRNLKLAYIDYDILCPKALIMAFESVGVKTFAVEERFLSVYYNAVSVFVDRYFVASAENVQKNSESRNYLINKVSALGQYRTDQVFKEFSCKSIINQGSEFKEIILVLGCHSDTAWEDNQVSPHLNWKAQAHFLREIIDLAQEYQDYYFIIRYKIIDWYELPYFAEVHEKIEEMQNVKVSTEYSIPFYSYYLLKNSAFVIGKPSSILDESLSIGKPVLIHDYTHNIQSIIRETFDYLGSRILCHNFEELKDRFKLLIENDQSLKNEIKEVADKLYENLSDGKIKERLHSIIKAEF